VLLNLKKCASFAGVRNRLKELEILQYVDVHVPKNESYRFRYYAFFPFLV
jgi:hypothetical protein